MRMTVNALGKATPDDSHLSKAYVVCSEELNSLDASVVAADKARQGEVGEGPGPHHGPPWSA